MSLQAPQKQNKATILCPLCGIRFTPEMGSICPTCTIKSVEEDKLLEGQDINYCRYCMRFQRPPWINCERESQEMLTILLKKIKGLHKVEVKSASFVWTEPHSKRLKLKVVFNREVNETMKIEVTQIVEFIQKYTQCNDCRKKFTPHDWIALVQVRQQVSHKKTIFNLEQILLKQKMLDRIIKTEEVEGGVDVFFGSENDATRLVDFLKGRLPLSLKTSSKLISHNERDNTSNIKTTYSCLIPKICKDDLIRIPKKLSKQLGCCEVLLCTKVSSSMHFLDVATFKKVSINATQYFLFEVDIQIFPLKVWGKKFTVLDCEVKEPESANRFPSYGLTFMKEQQYVQLYTKSHFPEDPGNQLIGYELTQIENVEGVKNLPDFVMVVKIKDKQQKKKNKQARRRKEAEIRRKESEAASRLAESVEDSGEDYSEWEDVDEKEDHKEEGHKEQHKKEQKQDKEETDEKQEGTEVQVPKKSEKSKDKKKDQKPKHEHKQKH